MDVYAISAVSVLGTAILAAVIGYIRKGAERRAEKNDDTRDTVTRLSVELEGLKTAAASAAGGPELITLSNNIAQLTETVLSKMDANAERLAVLGTTVSFLEKQVQRIADDHVTSRDLARATARG